MLTYYERKVRLPFGALAAVAEETQRSRTWITMVMKGAYRDREVERSLAKRMRPKTTVTEAFGARSETESLARPEPVEAA